ncbi:MAG: hypothetical protein U1E67_04475 [Hyphomicrobiales bacterium]
MNWELAIESKRVPLLGVVLALFAEIGLTEGGTVERIARPLHRSVLQILRSAESAVRRLIVAAARDIVLEHKPRRPASGKPKTSSADKTKAEAEAKPERKRRPLFSLFDALRRQGRRFKKKLRGPEPRIRVLGDPLSPWERMMREFGRPQVPTPSAAPVVEAKVDDGMVSARHLVRRLIAILDAVQDIPRHAMRLARWDARPFDERRPERSGPLRSGRPPGYRQRNIHEVDQILKDCDWLARLGNPPRDDMS